MKLRKQYSAKYQVLELEDEVTEEKGLMTLSEEMDLFAKQELAKMVALVDEIVPPEQKGMVSSFNKPATNEEMASEAQMKVINNSKNKSKASLIAENKGYNISKLTKKQASEIVSELFNQNKTGF
jgi:hypothetical protein